MGRLMANKACISLVPSEMGSDTRGRRISTLSTVVALGASGQHAALLNARKPMEVLVFNSKPVSLCILLRDYSYLSTTEVAKAHEFVKFACY